MTWDIPGDLDDVADHEVADSTITIQNTANGYRVK